MRAAHSPPAEVWSAWGTPVFDAQLVRNRHGPVGRWIMEWKCDECNRCPHLGSPLHRGTVQDGILTCHWHHARFDLCSGCTFDLFADDVPAYDVQLRGEDVYVAILPRQGNLAENYRRRLREGMEQNISLIQGKAIIGLLKTGVDYRDIVRQIALFGVQYRDGWASGMTIMTAMANLVPLLQRGHGLPGPVPGAPAGLRQSSAPG